MASTCIRATNRDQLKRWPHRLQLAAIKASQGNYLSINLFDEWVTGRRAADRCRAPITG
jgi:hypothetical protein